MRHLAPALAIAACIATLAAAGCNRKGAHRRSSDAAPVEVVAMPQLPDGGGGQAGDEIEPNDGDDVATVLALGGSMRGKIDPETDVDHYRIDVTQAGALAVMVASLEGLDTVLELQDGSGTVVARSDRGGARVREGIANFGVTPGRYTATVQAKKPAPPKRKPRRPPPEPPKPVGGPYEITASMVAPVAGIEHEPDDDRGEANDLIAGGDAASGFIGWTGDVDVWKVSVEALSARNALEIDLSAVEGIALSLEIADGIGQPIATRKAPKGAALAVRGFVPAVPQGAPPFHYLIVKADRSNPETAYQIRVAAKVIPPNTETEPNDTSQTAMLVPADRKSLAAHWSAGDVDCFAVPPDEAARTLEVSIDTPGELDLGMDALVDGKLVAKVDHPGKGAAEKLSAPVPAAAQAVVCVRGGDGPGDGPYELEIHEGAASP